MTEKTPNKNSVSRKPRTSKTSTRTRKTSTRTSKTGTQTNKTSSQTTNTGGWTAETDVQADKADSKPIEKAPQSPAEDDIPMAEIIPEIDLDSAALDKFLAEPPQEQSLAESDEQDLFIYDAEINDFPQLPPWPVVLMTIVVIALML